MIIYGFFHTRDGILLQVCVTPWWIRAGRTGFCPTFKAPPSFHEPVLCMVMKRAVVTVLNFFEQDVLQRDRTTGKHNSVSLLTAFWYVLEKVTGKKYLGRSSMCICRLLKGRWSYCLHKCMSLFHGGSAWSETLHHRSGAEYVRPKVPVCFFTNSIK